MVLPLPKRLAIRMQTLTDEERFLCSFRPLYALSKMFAFWTFTVSVTRDGDRSVVVGFRKSRSGTLHFFVMLVLYSTFHLYINSTDTFSEKTAVDGQGQVEASFVSVVIDMYNRYSGLLLFWWLHLMAHVCQPTVIDILRGVMALDEQIRARLSVAPDHGRWCRNVCLHVIGIVLGIVLAETFNCIMYMSDFNPASEYCVVQCLISMLACSTIEIQYVALVQLIKNRLELINSLLGELSAYSDEQQNAWYGQFAPPLQTGTRNARKKRSPNWSRSLLEEIAPRRVGELRGERPPQRITPEPERQAIASLDSHRPVGKPTSEPSIPAGEQRWQQIKRLQHKIITVSEAPPSHASSGSGEPPIVPIATSQFPLLVASLMNSQSKASDHIRMKIINDIKNLYTHLHLLSLNINRAYGAQLIFILMTLFVTLTTLLYYCTMKLLRILLLGRHTAMRDLTTPFEDVLSTLSWILIATVRILRLCSVCNGTKNEAQHVGSLIQGLGWKTHCSATKSAVRRLSLQLLQQRFEFSAGGLLSIDHGLMFNIVGSLATFLLILVQFDIAQGGAKWKPSTEPPANSTAQ
ncbi:uncharacterized protein LOC126576463 [Anopheles aquasalis]|uniref:uncharacterized protein LOC126576463 n=1 Tax=Anopheles aquasalis TaxID=42839 RepID=UPI00215A71B2|nr:uncharacterized protein LOC126576463 [Anopheles aquasalis]